MSLLLSNKLSFIKTSKNIVSSLYLIHWVVIFLSLGLTIFAWWYSKEQVAAKIQLQFDKQASQLVHLVIERIEKYEDALWGGVAKIHSDNNKVTYANWKSYVDSLNILTKYPGINGMGVIYNISKEESAKFLKEQRQSRQDFKIHPQHNHHRLLPITYIIPVKGNEQAVGLDMAFERNRFTAALKAEQTGKAQLTGPIVLVQDRERTPGFLLFAPFYSKQNLITAKERQKYFLGMVYAPFIMKKLMGGTLDQRNRDIAIKISDNKAVLFNELQPSDPHYDKDAQYKKQVNIQIYGRTWTFHLWSTSSFIRATSSNQPDAILFGGIIIDSLLLILFIQVSGARRSAVKYAKSLNKDIKRQAKKHATLNKRLELALSASKVGVWEYNILTKKLIWDDAMFFLYGVNKSDFTGDYEVWFKAFHPADKKYSVKMLELAISQKNKFDTSFRIILPDKSIRVIRALADVIFEDGQAKKVIGVNWDITDIKDKESQLEYLAKYDALSQLKNRFSFNQYCDTLIKQAIKTQSQFAFLLIDLDDFKQVNDLYGHHVGDKFISVVSDTLKSICRSGDFVFRLGGDEFAVLSGFIDDSDTSVEIAERIIHALHQSFDIDGNTVQSTCSIGVAIFPNAGGDVDELMSNADIALYKSKHEGKNCISYFTDSLSERAKRLRYIKSNLMKASGNGEIFMSYQPIVDIRTKKSIAIEALCRWHSSLGVIPPEEFISVAEKNNTVNLLGKEIIKKVANDCRNNVDNFKISINCSSKQLIKNSEFANFLCSTLKNANIPLKDIILEITESYLIRDYDDVRETLDELNKLGIEIAIDDFGTGYSSLSQLAHIPFQYLKVDKEFVTNMNTSAGNKVLQCIYNVAISLNKKVIAEGVETKEQLDKLVDMGIYLIQGYYFSKPVKFSELTTEFKVRQ